MSRKKNALGSYEVGYKKPPSEHRFVPGKSGNPTGGSRKKRSRENENLADIIHEEVQRKIPATSNGKSEMITVERAIIRSALAQAVRGSPAAIRHAQSLLEIARKSDKAISIIPIPDLKNMNEFEAQKAYERFMKIDFNEI